MNMSEKEFKEFLDKNPNRHYDEKSGTVQLQQSPKKQTSSPSTKRNKYRNTKVYECTNGMITFIKPAEKSNVSAVYDSQKEYSRWCELKQMERAGQISGLKRQVSMTIEEAFVYKGKKIRAIKYVADHIYEKNGVSIIEDVKPFDENTQKYRTTADFKLKWKLLKKRYPDYDFVLY